jgi:hypothetical protein
VGTMSGAGPFLSEAAQGGSFQGGGDLKSLLLRGILNRVFRQTSAHETVSPELVLQAAFIIEAHQLLREADASGADTANKQNVVEQWVTQLLTTLGSPSASAKWAAACLSGLTCKECGAERFLGFYQTLAVKLLAMWKEGEEVQVRAAVLAGLSDLLGRLGELADMPGVRREGGGIVARIAQPLIGVGFFFLESSRPCRDMVR